MGKVFVVGIGPGNFENMTIRADRALCACDAIVGYPVYVDLVKDRYPGKALYQTPMTKEVARCQLALDLAREGKTVCSGSIFAMKLRTSDLPEAGSACNRTTLNTLFSMLFPPVPRKRRFYAWIRWSHCVLSTVISRSRSTYCMISSEISVGCSARSGQVL